MFRHYLHSGRFAAIAKWTTSMAHLGAERFGNLDFPLPPLNEQRRIVAKLDELTTRSRAAREALDAIPPLLERFRQSVLAAAFRGDLTAEWRRQNPDVEAVVLNASTVIGPRTLPSTWSWSTVGSICQEDIQTGPFGAQLHRDDFVTSGVPVVAIGNVKWGQLDLAKLDFVTPTKASLLEKYRLRTGDVLFTRSGTVGRSAIASSDVEGAVMSSHILRIRLSSGTYLPELMFRAFRGEPAVHEQLRALTRGATRAGFNTGLLSGLLLPVPPLQEQQEILQMLRAMDAEIDAQRAYFESLSRQLATLDRAFLRAAFHGQLVPQDPSDEPASALLDRLRAERAAQPKNTRSKRART